MIDWQKYSITAPAGTTGHRKTFCPQCRDVRSDKRDRSLSIDLATGLFKCHYCGWSGCARERSQWEREHSWHNCSPLRAARKEYAKPSPAKGGGKFSQQALDWFGGRGISATTLEKLRLSEGEEWMPQKNRAVNTVQFNYYVDGELVNVKYRTGDKCFKLHQGARLVPYNIDAVKGREECIVTEGEIDALSFVEIGRDDVVSVPNGANTNLDYLDDFIETHFDDKKTIYLATDTDTKGLMLRRELLRRFGAERCRLVDFGPDCKDANEHLQRHGFESLRRCLAEAREVSVEGVFSVSDFEDSLDALFDKGLQKGVTIGHDNFDRLCSFETRRLLIVTGLPGSGKSEFIDEICERLNVRHGWRFAYFSPENAPLAYHASKLIEKLTGKKFGRATLTFGEYRQAKEHLERDFSFIAPTDNFRLDNILEKARYLVRRKGIKGLVIDPYNRLESEQGSRPETQYISLLLDKLTNFAQINDVLVVLMAHPAKLQRNRDGVIDPPTLYDISGSANFFNKADFGIVVHRDRLTDQVLVNVQKVKFKHLGECGTAYFKYNATNGRYTPYYSDSTLKHDYSNHLAADNQKEFVSLLKM